MQHLWSTIKQSIIQSGLPDPGCVAQLIGALPIYRKIVGLIPGQDVYRRQPIDVSLSHQCFSFSFSQINRRVLRGGFKKKTNQRPACLCQMRKLSFRCSRCLRWCSFTTPFTRQPNREWKPLWWENSVLSNLGPQKIWSYGTEIGRERTYFH